MATKERPDLDHAELCVEENDERMCEAILEILVKEPPQKVLLVGEAGIGKTRLAKKVGKYAEVYRGVKCKNKDKQAISERYCFLTICLHLNKKFDDVLSLYENLASQLSVYSDFEETEVGDRDEEDEDEEKKDPEALLKDLKNKIVVEIEKRDLAAANKHKEEFDKADGKPKKSIEKPDAEAEEKAKEAERIAKKERYLLLILDDEGSKVNESKMISTKVSEFKKFLEDKALQDPTRLRVLVTKRKGVEEATETGDEPTKTDEEPTETGEATDAKGDGSESTDEEEKNASESASADKISEEGSNSQPTGQAVAAEPDVATVPPPGDKPIVEEDMTHVLLESIDEFSLQELFVSIMGKDGQAYVQLLPKIVSRCKKSPAAIVVLAKSLKQITRITSHPGKEKKLTEKERKEKKEEAEKLKEKIQEQVKERIIEFLSADRFAPPERGTVESPGEEEVILADQSNPSDRGSTAESPGEEEDRSADQPNPSDSGSTPESPINAILHLAYQLLETTFPLREPGSPLEETGSPLKEAILDCFWHSLDFFEHCGCVYYRDLITQWILEGYFDPVRSVEKAYEKGHYILMELINRGMLKIQENNVVVPEMTMINLIDPRRRGIFGRSRLRFSKVYVGDKKKGVGKINQIDDMIKTVQAKKGDKISTILVSGDRLRLETPVKYFRKLDDLEVLGLFEPTVDPLVPALLELQTHLIQKKPDEEPYKELRVLLIRDCDLLNNIDDLITFRQLQVLEVSGASSLEEIPDKFFKEMPGLQSLHLSGLQITHSPSSISDLEKLHCLIIRDCPLLEDLPNIQGLLELEVVDISGARGLKTCFDNTSGNTKDKSKNKNFYQLKKLQHLDFSESQIERLPIFQDSAVPEKLHSLTRLLLRNCSKLRRLPSLKPLSGLQILDLSGTTSLVEMLEVCFEDKKELTSLNLTGTNLGELATTINELSNLKELLLKDCTKLKQIPDIQNLTNLEVVDVSGCTELTEIEGSFENMFYLREVDLSGSNVVIKPDFLPKKSETNINIRCVKRFIRADGKRFVGENWTEVREAMQKEETSNEASSSAEVVESQETSEKEPAGEIQLDDSRTRDCTDKKGDVSKERLLQVPADRDIYVNIMLSVVNTIPKEVMEINETTESSEEALTKAEFLSFGDISTTKLTSVFNKINSAKGCWIKESSDIKDLFFEVEEARLGSLETLSITNIPGLDSISRGGSYKNLKNLIVVNCSNIIMLFPEASQLPGNLKELRIMYCEKLEKVFKEGEVSTLNTLCLVGLPVLSCLGARLPNLETLVKRDCPKLLAEKEDLKSLDWVAVDHTDAQPDQTEAQPQPQAQVQPQAQPQAQAQAQAQPQP